MCAPAVEKVGSQTLFQRPWQRPWQPQLHIRHGTDCEDKVVCCLWPLLGLVAEELAEAGGECGWEACRTTVLVLQEGQLGGHAGGR